MNLTIELIEGLLKGSSAPSVRTPSPMCIELLYANADAFVSRCSADDEVMRMGITGLTVASAEQHDVPADSAEHGVVPPPAILVTYTMTPAAPAAVVAHVSKRS